MTIISHISMHLLTILVLGLSYFPRMFLCVEEKKDAGHAFIVIKFRLCTVVLCYVSLYAERCYVPLHSVYSCIASSFALSTILSRHVSLCTALSSHVFLCVELYLNKNVYILSLLQNCG